MSKIFHSTYNKNLSIQLTNMDDERMQHTTKINNNNNNCFNYGDHTNNSNDLELTLMITFFYYFKIWEVFYNWTDEVCLILRLQN